MSRVPRLPRHSEGLRAHLLDKESKLSVRQAADLIFWPLAYRGLEATERSLRELGYLPTYADLWSRVLEAVGKVLDESQHEGRGST